MLPDPNRGTSMPYMSPACNWVTNYPAHGTPMRSRSCCQSQSAGANPRGRYATLIAAFSLSFIISHRRQTCQWCRMRENCRRRTQHIVLAVQIMARKPRASRTPGSQQATSGGQIAQVGDIRAIASRAVEAVSVTERHLNNGGGNPPVSVFARENLRVSKRRRPV